MTARKNNTLSAAQKFRLNLWVSNNAQKHIGLTYLKIAKLATEALGFAVSYSNIEGAYQATDAEKPRPNPNKEAGISSYKKARTLARAIADLCKELEFFPKNFDEILKIAESRDAEMLP